MDVELTKQTVEVKVSLKPCPFCGAKAKLFQDEGENGLWAVACTNTSDDGCYISGIIDWALLGYDTPFDAAEGWNKRITPPVRNFQKYTAKEFSHNVIWVSEIRQKVLERDNFTCQRCGKKKPSKFHIHHVLKIVDGGSDCLDNLVTVCPKCHRAVDSVEYAPEW